MLRAERAQRGTWTERSGAAGGGMGGWGDLGGGGGNWDGWGDWERDRGGIGVRRGNWGRNWGRIGRGDWGVGMGGWGRNWGRNWGRVGMGMGDRGVGVVEMGTRMGSGGRGCGGGGRGDGTPCAPRSRPRVCGVGRSRRAVGCGAALRAGCGVASPREGVLHGGSMAVGGGGRAECHRSAAPWQYWGGWGGSPPHPGRCAPLPVRPRGEPLR